MRRLATYSSCYTLILSSEYEDQGKKMGVVGADLLDLSVLESILRNKDLEVRL